VCVRLHFCEFYCTSCIAFFLLLILSVCLYVSCLWALLPDLSKVMMMMIKTNCHPSLYHFEVVADRCSNFGRKMVALHFWAPFGTVWNTSVSHRVSCHLQERYPLVERAISAALCSNLSVLLAYLHSWKDHVWAYFRALVDQKVERHIRSSYTGPRHHVRSFAGPRQPLPLPSSYTEET